MSIDLAVMPMAERAPALLTMLPAKPSRTGGSPTLMTSGESSSKWNAADGSGNYPARSHSSWRPFSRYIAS
jgi:hypothetical protein